MYYCFCTASYLPWLEILVQSLRRVDPYSEILVHFLGDIGNARRVFKDYRYFTLEKPPFEPSPGISLAGLLELRARNVLTIARSHDFEWLMAMDADLLVRKPLSHLARPTQLFDFAAVIRGRPNGGELDLHLQVSAALYLLTKNGLPILEEFNRLLAQPCCIRGKRRGEWFWEQACFAEAVLSSDLRIRSIPRELYLSSRPFDPRALVWNANFRGTCKQAAFKVFTMELRRLERAGVQ
jgi:hypothetical protein